MYVERETLRLGEVHVVMVKLQSIQIPCWGAQDAFISPFVQVQHQTGHHGGGYAGISQSEPGTKRTRAACIEQTCQRTLTVHLE